MGSYQPKESLSTIWLTSAPSRDFSNSAQITPFSKGIKLFSRQTAMWIGIRQRRSTSHSPAGYRDTFQFELEAVLDLNDSKSVEDTLILRSLSPVGFLVSLTNPWMRSEK